MYGYNVVAIRVSRKDAGRSGAPTPLQIDNLDGLGLDLAAEWRAFFAAPRSEFVARDRRFWQCAAARHHRVSGSPHSWQRLDVEYGANGIPGRVLDTAGGASLVSFRSQDAAVHRYRHLIARPRGGTAMLLAAEVIGRGRAFRGPTDAFRKHLETTHGDLRLSFDYLADGEYWEQFLAGARLISATLSKQSSIPAYTDGSTSGQSVAATVETTIKAAGRGHRLPSSLIRPLLNRKVSPREAFGVTFDPDRLSLLLEADGQRRRVYLDRGELADLVYPIGDPDRRGQPSDAEFTSAAAETVSRLLARYPS